jgi:YVTN family beta-propeller protein
MPQLQDCEMKLESPQKSTKKKSATMLSIRLLALAAASLPFSACRSHDFPQYPADYREYIYVTNEGSGTVTVIDAVNVRVDREIAVGQNPVALANSPTRNEIYVLNSGTSTSNGSLSVLDAQRNSVVATIPLHRQPVSIDLDSNGDIAYIANQGSNFISVIDIKARREIAQIGAGEQPDAARITPDGKTLVVANRGGNSVTLIDPASRTVRSVIENCPGAGDPVVMPNSSKAFIPCAGGHQVMVIALARPAQNTAQSGAPGDRPAWEPDRLETIMDVGRGPVHLALKPDSGELFVSNSLSDSISEVVTGTDDVGGAYLMGDHPVRGLVSRDNTLLYVANQSSQYVTVYSIDDGRRVGSVHVGDGPADLAFSANGLLLFVVDSRSGDVAVVRTATRALFTLLPAGRNPNAIVDKAFRIQ